MSPRVADEAVRMALIEQAASIVATDGGAALSLRRLAREVGTSTMAVYTHFGSMGELRREVRREGFRRLGAYLNAVSTTADPVADLGVLGVAYHRCASAAPHLYRAMFMEGPVDETDTGTGLDTFEQLVGGVRRCIKAGRFRLADPAELATQLWALNHGLISLEIARMLTPSQVREAMVATGANLMIAFGDDPASLARSGSAIADRAARFVAPPVSA